MKASFSRLCLGARFRYVDPRVTKTWVKIDANTIAEWNPAHAASNWAGQQVCSFADGDDDESLAQEVELAELTELEKWCTELIHQRPMSPEWDEAMDMIGQIVTEDRP